eukprot:gene1144-1309_t
MSWQGTSNALSYVFSLKAGFRYSFFVGNTDYPTVPTVGSTFFYNYIYLDTKETVCDFWLFGCWSSSVHDVQYKIATSFVVNNIDKSSDWMTCEMRFQYTFSEAFDATLAYQDGNRVSDLQNNANGLWNIATFVPVSKKMTYLKSPVSGLLPVIPAIMGETNYITIPTSEPSTFRFSSSSEMPGNQPTGLVLNPVGGSSGGKLIYNPTGLGLWCAQLRVTESGGQGAWIVVDFILNVTKRIITDDSPPFFLEPKPDIVIECQANKVCMAFDGSKPLSLIGSSPQPTSTVYISVANLPSGMKAGTQTNNRNVGTVVLNWIPTTSQVGDYVISAGLIDSKGITMVGSMLSFTVRVTAIECGNGVVIPAGGCKCNAGWTGPDCDQCAPGYYGPTCIIVPKCVNGTSSSGIWGDGKCLCNPGFTGPACDISVVKMCSLADPTTIIGQTSNLNSNVAPDVVQLYISVNSTASPFSVPTLVKTPDNIPLDIFFLLDVSVPAAGNAQYTLFKQNYGLMKSSLLAKRDQVNFGLGTFSDSVNQANSFQLVSNLRADIASDISSTLFTVGEPQPNIPYQVAIDATNRIGWTANKNTVKMIVLVTDNNLAPTDNTMVTKLKAALAASNVLFGVFSLNSASSYTPLISDGINAVAFPANTWFTTMADSLVFPLVKTLKARVIGDTYGFVSVAPTLASGSTFNTVYKYPATPVPAQYPSLKIAIIGFGIQTVQIQFNHAPVTSPTVQVNTVEDTGVYFNILANDIDNNPLNISFVSLPSKGSIVLGGVPVNAGDLYPLPASTSTNAIRYQPNANVNGTDSATLIVTDGCTSSPVVVTFAITAVNDPPTCQDKVIVTDQNTPVTFSVSISDIDSASTSVEFTSTGSIANIGSLTDMLNGVVTDNNQYLSTASFTFTPVNTAANSTVVIPFIGRDTGLSCQCSLSITVARVNTPPVLLISSPQNMIPDALKIIPFSFSDIDSNEQITVTVKDITAKTGVFTTATNQPITEGTVLGVFDMTANSNNSFLYYKSNSDVAQTGIQFTIEIADKNNAKDSRVVQINVAGNRANSPPSTVILPLIETLEAQDVNFTLDGTDPDRPTWDNILDIQIQSLPAHGVLLGLDGQPIVANPKTVYGVTYRPNPGFFGDDSFSFGVADSLGANSAPQDVKIYVSHVNHAPTMSAPEVFARGSMNVNPSVDFTVAASDVDVIDTITVFVSEIPTLGEILTSDGVAITAAALPLALTNLTLTYQAPTNVFYAFTSNYTVAACENGTFSLTQCTFASSFVSFTYINTAPSGKGVKLTLEQDSNTTFTLEATDFEDTQPRVRFTTLPSSGYLVDESGANVTSTTTLYATPTFTYVPFPGTSNDDTPGGTGPLENFYYVAVDQNSTESLSNTIVIFVSPVKPPIYRGPTEISTNEDTQLPINIDAISQYNKIFSMNMLHFSGNGTLNFIDCNSTDCKNTPVTGDTAQVFTSSSYKFTYMPPKDVNGVKIDWFEFFLFENNASKVITVYIDVIPVNDPPAFIPISYTHADLIVPYVKEINIDMNTSTIITWNATDIDSPYLSLTSTLNRRIITNGAIYSYVDGVQGAVIANGEIVPRSTDGLWRIAYTPRAGISGKNIEQMVISTFDDYDLATTVTLFASVHPVNVAPFVTIVNPEYNSTINTQFILTGVNVTDPDSYNNNNNITFSLTLLDSEGNVANATISLPSARASACNVTTAMNLTCVDDNKSLNYYLDPINIAVAVEGNYTLQVYVNDLGYNSDPANRTPLSDTKYISIVISHDPPGVKKTKNTTVLSAAIAGAAVAAALIALGVWRIVKARAPPTDAFFGDSPFADSQVSSNPLYTASQNFGENPLYADGAAINN